MVATGAERCYGTGLPSSTGFYFSEPPHKPRSTQSSELCQRRSKEDYIAMSKQPEVQAHMKQAAALAISFDPVDDDLRDIVLAE